MTPSLYFKWAHNARRFTRDTTAFYTCQPPRPQGRGVAFKARAASARPFRGYDQEDAGSPLCWSTGKLSDSARASHLLLLFLALSFPLNALQIHRPPPSLGDWLPVVRLPSRPRRAVLSPHLALLLCLPLHRPHVWKKSLTISLRASPLYIHPPGAHNLTTLGSNVLLPQPPPPGSYAERREEGMQRELALAPAPFCLVGSRLTQEETRHTDEKLNGACHPNREKTFGDDPEMSREAIRWVRPVPLHPARDRVTCAVTVKDVREGEENDEERDDKNPSGAAGGGKTKGEAKRRESSAFESARSLSMYRRSSLRTLFRPS